MGFVDSIKSLFSPSAKKEKSLTFPFGTYNREYAGEQVSVRTAIQHETVYSCIKVLSEAVGQLPIELYDSKGNKVTGGRQVSVVTKQPNEYQTMQEFVETAITGLMLYGNFYAEIKRSPTGSITRLIPFKYQRSVSVEMDGDGIVYYTYTTNDSDGGIYHQQTAKYEASKIFHLKLNNSDGFRGLSPITTAAMAVGTALAQDKHQANTMKNGAMLKGMLTTEQQFKDRELLIQAQDEWDRNYSGASNSGKTPILDAGLKYSPMSISSVDSQLLESRQFSREQIAAMFQVPLHKLGVSDAIKYGTVEQSNIAFMRDALMPIITKIENNLELILTGNLKVKFKTSEFTRGDTAAETAAVGESLKLGLISVNEGRKRLGYAPIEGGDVFAIDTNNLTFGSFEEISSLQAQPQTEVNQNANQIP